MARKQSPATMMGRKLATTICQGKPSAEMLDMCIRGVYADVSAKGSKQAFANVEQQIEMALWMQANARAAKADRLARGITDEMAQAACEHEHDVQVECLAREEMFDSVGW
jgi:hypothetical protein